MAEDKKPKRSLRKVETMRDKAQRATGGKNTKTRRLSRTAGKLRTPFVAARRIGKKEFHIVTPKESGLKGFLTRSRKWTPGYFRSSYQELRQVTWPSRKETWKLVLAVFIFAIAFGLVITIIDFGLEKLFRKAFL